MDIPKDLITSILAPIAEFLVKKIGRQLGYLVYYNSNVELLKSRVGELESRHLGVQQKVNAAERNTEDILPPIKDWLTKVDEVQRKGDVFFKEEVKANQMCFGGPLCPDLKSRYKVSRKAKKMTLDIDRLLVQGMDNVVSVLRRLPAIGSTITTDLEAFESRKSTLNQIMVALKKDTVSLIGVYGMGGIGKTTLVKEVLKQAEQSNLFDEIVMAVVSQTPNVRTIQGEIADSLGLKFQEESVTGRACRLCERLKEKRVLVILDDLWKGLNLGDIGIPCGNVRKGCKILITSRDHDVCINMSTQENFQIEVLPEDEAWNLFRITAGNSVNSSDLNSIARDVAKECAGLPIAIVTVAAALKSKGFDVWSDALQRFRKSAPNIDGVYSTLQLSYDFLEGKEIKSFFLLCCLFPEDCDIEIEYLVICGMGLRLFEHIYSLQEVRVRALALIDSLKARCLLLDGKTNGSVRMHDIIRAFCLKVASEGDNVFLVRVATEEWPPEIDTWDHQTAISLQQNKFHELPDGLVCRKLNLLWLGWNSLYDPSNNLDLLGIPPTFFLEMKMLRVLVITHVSIYSLPSSIQCLKDLRTLCLDYCKLGDISLIGELKEKLEILSFRNSDIEELPMEIGQMTHLRLLNLSNCRKLKIIPPGVISSLSGLEDLYMLDSFNNWEVEHQQHMGKRNASLAEMKSLSRLSVLEIHIPNIKVWPEELLFGNLIKFQIFVGDLVDYPDEQFYTKASLRMVINRLDRKITLCSGLNLLLKKAECLILKEIEDLENVLCDSTTGDFSKLKWLRVTDCGGNENLIKTTGWISNSIFPLLEELNLCRMQKLTNLWKDPSRHECLRNLRVIEVSECSKLKNLFSQYTASDLGKLQELHIESCASLEEIFANDGGPEVSMGEVVLQNLNSMRLKGLQRLITFLPPTSTGSLDSITHPVLFNGKVVFPTLKNLCISGLDKVEEIWHQQLPIESLRNLESLQIVGCECLRNVFPRSASEGLINLQDLSIWSCDIMEEIVVDERREEDMKSTDVIVFPQLRYLELGGLPELMSFYHGKGFKGKLYDQQGNPDAITEPVFFNEKVVFPSLGNLSLRDLPKVKEIWHKQILLNRWQSLSSLEIDRCNGLRNVFPRSWSKGLAQLRQLRIYSCELLKELVGNERGEENVATDVIVFSQLNTLILDNLPEFLSVCRGINCTSEKLTIDEQDNVGAIFSEKVVFPSLEDLSLGFLPKVKEIWHKQILLNRWPSLNSLEIDGCNGLRNVFPRSWSKGLTQLRYLRIYSCELLKELVGNERGEEENVATDVIVFSQLHTLILYDLPEFLSVHRGINYTSDKLTIDEQDNFGAIFSEKVVFPSLENLSLRDLPKVKEIWHKQILLNRWQSLSSLEIDGCNGLRNVFPRSWSKGLVQLKNLEIKSCPLLKELVGNERGEEENEATDVIVFSQLHILILDDLPEFLSVHRGINYTSDKLTIDEQDNFGAIFSEKVAFPSLENLSLRCLPKVKEIWHKQILLNRWQSLSSLVIFCCHGLRNVFPRSWSKGLAQLRELEIKSCQLLKELVGNERGEEENEATDVIVFSQLHTLILDDLPEFLSVHRGINYTSDKLTIDEQDNVGAIFSEKVVFPSLENLSLRCLPKVKEIWYKQILLNRWQSLSSLKIFCCNGLRNVFPRSWSKGPVQLKILEIKSCQLLKELVGNERGEEEIVATDVIVFSQLHTLILDDLPEFLSVHRGINCTSDKLTIDEQDNVGAIFSEKVLFPALKELRICNLQSLNEIWPNQFPVGSFGQLRVLEVEKCVKLLKVVPYNLIQRLQNLEQLSVKECDAVEDVIQFEGPLYVKQHVNVVLSQLRRLTLSYLPKLVEMWWNKDCNGILSCANLSELEVIQCNSLRNIFLPSMAKRFVNLKLVHLRDCLNIEEVVGKEEQGEDSGDKLAFPSLNHLHLENCPKLRSFYSGNLTLELPSLSFLSLEKCPNLHTFSSWLVITPKLSFIEHSVDQNWMQMWEGDLNSTIQKLFRVENKDNEKEENKDEDNEEEENKDDETIIAQASHGEKSEQVEDQA